MARSKFLTEPIRGAGVDRGGVRYRRFFRFRVPAPFIIPSPFKLAALGIVCCVVGLGLSVEARADEKVQFTYRAPKVADRGSQAVDISTHLIISIQQSGQVVQSTDRSMRRHQRRAITAVSVVDGRVTRMKVTFLQAHESTADNGQPPKVVEHPVEGQTYLAFRESPDDPLQVTDPQGKAPSAEEIAMVTAAMEAVGQRNPLAWFFRDRRVKVGATVRVPGPIANDALGFQDSVGEVTRFDLTLRSTEVIEGRRCAVFSTAIDAQSPLAADQRLTLRGQIVLDTDSCHTVAIDVHCPVEVTETRGPPGAQFSLHGKGTLHVAMTSRRVLEAARTSP